MTQGRRRASVSILMLLVFVFAFSGAAFAQAGNASLGGVVQDSTNALIPGVSVKAKNVDTGVELSTLTW